MSYEIAVDLHLHTSYSDGVLSPKDLVNLCYKNGLKHISITDHDCTDGIQESIEIDADKGLLKVNLFFKNLKKRKKKWKPKKIEYTSGTLWKYSQSVGPAYKGAVTHPGSSKEKKCYADI